MPKSLGTHYSNIERQAVGILHGLEKFPHYCFTLEVILIMDDKPLVMVFKKDIASLSHRLQRILLWIHKYNIKILHKLGLPQIITD